MKKSAWIVLLIVLLAPTLFAGGAAEPGAAGAAGAAAAMEPGTEPPFLAARVASGELPPMAERIPQDPLVIEPYEKIGVYGGTWRTGSSRGFTTSFNEEVGLRRAHGADSGRRRRSEHDPLDGDERGLVAVHVAAAAWNAVVRRASIHLGRLHVLVRLTFCRIRSSRRCRPHGSRPAATWPTSKRLMNTRYESRSRSRILSFRCSPTRRARETFHPQSTICQQFHPTTCRPGGIGSAHR
jgi:hypothetical protein